MGFLSRFAGLQLSALSEASKKTRPLHKLALRVDPKTPLTNLFRANEHSNGKLGELTRLAARIPSFYTTMKSLLSESESLGFQDLIFAALFPERLQNSGYFIEIGVGDGRVHSNTWLFERAFGWSGLLIEPNPRFHGAIRDQRPNAALETTAAFDRSDVLTFVDDDRLGGIAERRDYARHQARGEGKGLIEVETAPTEELFARHAVPETVDFMTVDTEGSEKEILSAIDFSRRRFLFLCVEHNFDRAREGTYKALLQPLGYRQILPNASGIDAIFVHQSVEEEIRGRIQDF